MVRLMTRTAQIACVVIFIAVMVAFHQGATFVANYMGGDFSFGFAVGGLFVSVIFLICHKLEAGKAARGVHAAAQKERSRDFLDL